MYAESSRQVKSHALPSTAQLVSTAKIAPKVSQARVSDRNRPAGVIPFLMRLWSDWRARRDLQRLPDHVLSDIGLSRADVERETLQPFWTPLDYDTLETQRRRAAMSRSPRYY
ncbi:DUF1127 domain-containing protein [Geminicoccus roseus]|uniref:DUF1127 domain-containing protein n=1 Tax=Geminicoccus roseus TaxID=404900 RepID=UPI00041FD3AD|nr:DUF1127 domain-containing protein [Geminicoccus roseus]